MKTLLRSLVILLFATMVFAPSACASTGVAVAGNTVTFSVTADGTTPFQFQWYKNGTAIAGATAQTYVISNFAATDVGTYYVVVTNAAGSATSDNAVLSAILKPGNVVTAIVVTQNGQPVTYSTGNK